MKLVASVICRNELDRYLEPFLAHLLEFCDEVRVLDDGSDDGTGDWLTSRLHAGAPLGVKKVPTGRFFEHEGRARQELLEWTLRAEPTHVLAIDADEFVADGAQLRDAIRHGGAAWTLDMEEVWRAEDECLCVRTDGGWRPHPVPILYRVPPNASRDPQWRIQDRKLASGREPLAVRTLARRARPTGTEILHFGWANESDRHQRYLRYHVADGGKFHAGAHLLSIMNPPDRVTLAGRDWPPALGAYRPALLARAARL